MKYNAKQYAQALVEVCESKSKTQVGVMVNEWLTLIKERGQLALINEIVGEIELLLSQGQLEANVKSARPLTKELKKWIEEYLKEHCGCDKLVIKDTVESALLAGMVVTYRDKKLDLSLANTLLELRESIVN